MILRTFILLLVVGTQVYSQSWVNKGKITSDSSLAGTGYGWSVAIDGDYLVVAELTEGVVEVWHFDGSEKSKVAELTAKEGVYGDGFGSSVSISGNNVVVGAELALVQGVSSGAAYIYTKPSGGWHSMTETAKITPSTRADGNRFGSLVALSGSTIAVGCSKDDSHGKDAGIVYIYEQHDQGWTDMTETAQLFPLSGQGIKDFGSILGFDGDHAVVADKHVGTIYVFVKPLGGWVDGNESAKLSAADSTVFGFVPFSSICVSNKQIVAGSYGLNGDVGSIYIFTEPIEGWSDAVETTKITPSITQGTAFFGSPVEASGDLIVVGDLYGGHGGIDSIKGAVSVYQKPIEGWTASTGMSKIVPADGVPGDYFGASIGVSGDKIIVGATGLGSNRIKPGAAYLYSTGPSLRSQVPLKSIVSKAIPNPSTGSFTISSPQPIKSVQIYNQLGTLVLSQTSIEVDILDQPKGVYYIHVQTAGTSEVLRMVLQ